MYFAEMQAAQRPAKTIRSYGMDLLRWYRFLWAVGVEWDRAERADARDFARWLRLVDKPVRVHWRHVGDASRAAGVVPVIPGAVRAGAGEVNPVTGKPSPGRKFAASTRAHNETVVRTFYDFHLEAGNGRSSTRFRCTAPGPPAVRMRTTTRWRSSARSALAATGRPCPNASRGASQMRSSTSCSRGCGPTATGPCSHSGCRAACARRNCSPAANTIRSRVTRSSR